MCAVNTEYFNSITDISKQLVIHIDCCTLVPSLLTWHASLERAMTSFLPGKANNTILTPCIFKRKASGKHLYNVTKL